MFETTRGSAEADVVAPDGSDVRIMLALERGSMAQFELAAGQTSLAVRHRTVEEIWFITDGEGEMWRQADAVTEVVPLAKGLCLTIPCGTAFQFRAVGARPLCILGVTMPPWPGDGEAIRTDGEWTATVQPGPGLAER